MAPTRRQKDAAKMFNMLYLSPHVTYFNFLSTAACMGQDVEICGRRLVALHCSLLVYRSSTGTRVAYGSDTGRKLHSGYMGYGTRGYGATCPSPMPPRRLERRRAPLPDDDAPEPRVEATGAPGRQSRLLVAPTKDYVLLYRFPFAKN